jgi:hypothetical protein
MVQHEQRDSFHFRRRSESQHDFAVPMRSHAVILPSLLGDFAFGVDNLQGPFISLRLRRRAALSLIYDLAGVLLQNDEQRAKCLA